MRNDGKRQSICSRGMRIRTAQHSIFSTCCDCNQDFPFEIEAAIQGRTARLPGDCWVVVGCDTKSRDPKGQIPPNPYNPDADNGDSGDGGDGNGGSGESGNANRMFDPVQ